PRAVSIRMTLVSSIERKTFNVLTLQVKKSFRTCS
ncbi:hypothetical protein EC890511_4796, partial [Escherichia coli 89.0511]